MARIATSIEFDESDDAPPADASNDEYKAEESSTSSDESSDDAADKGSELDGSAPEASEPEGSVIGDEVDETDDEERLEMRGACLRSNTSLTIAPRTQQAIPCVGRRGRGPPQDTAVSGVVRCRC